MSVSHKYSVLPSPSQLHQNHHHHPRTAIAIAIAILGSDLPLQFWEQIPSKVIIPPMILLHAHPNNLYFLQHVFKVCQACFGKASFWGSFVGFFLLSCERLLSAEGLSGQCEN